MPLLTGRLRKLTLTSHVTASVGWLGAVLAYLALAIAALSTEDLQLARAAIVSMELIGWSVIVACAFGALFTGLVQSLGTEWGLFRHYWVLTKLILTVIGTIILVVHMRTVSRVADTAIETLFARGDFELVRTQLLVHAAGGLLILLTATVLSIFKPWGRTKIS